MNNLESAVVAAFAGNTLLSDACGPLWQNTVPPDKDGVPYPVPYATFENLGGPVKRWFGGGRYQSAKFSVKIFHTDKEALAELHQAVIGVYDLSSLPTAIGRIHGMSLAGSLTKATGRFRDGRELFMAQCDFSSFVEF